MGVYYSLYAKQSKAYIHLGKHWDSQYQMSAERIVAFLSEHHGEDLILLDDVGEYPEFYNSDWYEADSWFKEYLDAK
jgi:hypothetical protein